MKLIRHCFRCSRRKHRDWMDIRHIFQCHWDVCDPMIRIVHGEESAECINGTISVLIPKEPNLSLLSQFRPTSLWSVLYKIASKVVANRLKMILSEIISKEQSAFMSGRLITNNIILTYECFYFMKRSRAKKNIYCALKLDMMKAYIGLNGHFCRL